MELSANSNCILLKQSLVPRNCAQPAARVGEVPPPQANAAGAPWAAARKHAFFIAACRCSHETKARIKRSSSGINISGSGGGSIVTTTTTTTTTPRGSNSGPNLQQRRVVLAAGDGRHRTRALPATQGGDGSDGSDGGGSKRRRHAASGARRFIVVLRLPP